MIMKAIEYRKSIPRFLMVRGLARRWGSVATNPLSACIRLAEVEPPALPGPRWVRLRVIQSGICGSDLATVFAKGSMYFSPLLSFPFVLGHELVATVAETGKEVSRWQEGERVVVQPALGCQVRGIDPPCDFCRSGSVGNCVRVMDGDISAGIQTGYCRDTGGGWASELVAHESQLFRVPEGMADSVAVLAEPFACALHAALKVRSEGVQRIIILGCGTIGLLSLLALRLLGRKDRIIAIARHPHQASLARDLGADETVSQRDASYEALSQVVEAKLFRPEIGKPIFVGGVEVCLDCVGSSASIDDAVRFCGPRGQVILVGMPAVPKGIDWTAIWYKELEVAGCYAYGTEQWQGSPRATFDLALELMTNHPEQFSRLVTHHFKLDEYRGAIHTASHTGPIQSIKTVFDIG